MRRHKEAMQLKTATICCVLRPQHLKSDRSKKIWQLSLDWVQWDVDLTVRLFEGCEDDINWPHLRLPTQLIPYDMWHDIATTYRATYFKFPRNIFSQHLFLWGNVSKTDAKISFLLVCNFIAFILGDPEVFTEAWKIFKY